MNMFHVKVQPQLIRLSGVAEFNVRPWFIDSPQPLNFEGAVYAVRELPIVHFTNNKCNILAKTSQWLRKPF